jgi:hypothetical protein
MWTTTRATRWTARTGRTNRLAFSTRWDSQPAPALAGLRNSDPLGHALQLWVFIDRRAPIETTVRVLLDDGTSLQVPAIASGVARCGEGDFAEPFFVLDLADIQRYIQLFTAGSQEADIREPFLCSTSRTCRRSSAGSSAGCP